jgi:SagB-type dehydrogenase family enzyme
MARESNARMIPLPKPCLSGAMSLETALSDRRSVREYTREPVSLTELSQLLWAAQGVTHADGGRTAPSAGALYPLELYLLAGHVTGLETGLYKYRIGRHELVELGPKDLRRQLADAALRQPQVEAAAAVIVITGVVARTAAKYGQRALPYVYMEVGCVAQSIHLQAAALGLGTVFIGAFRDRRVKQLLDMPAPESPFAILPIGRLR